MELPLFSLPATPRVPQKAVRITNFEVRHAIFPYFASPSHIRLFKREWKNYFVPYALPETAASVVVTATAVSIAAVLLTRTRKTSETVDTLRICEDCSGSGICAECKGEGFILKKMSDGSSEKARMAAKNMATRYTAGLPKKWSYCSKCSSSRSCSTCGGSGRLT